MPNRGKSKHEDQFCSVCKSRSMSAGNMISPSRKGHSSIVLAASTTGLAAAFLLGCFAMDAGVTLLPALLWAGLALCLIMSMSIFGETSCHTIPTFLLPPDFRQDLCQ